MSLTLDPVVSVDILVSPQGPTARGFGTALIIGANALPLEERIRTYTNLAGVAVDFATNTEEYKCATVYFARSPAPKQLLIGNRFAAAQAGKLRGSAGVSAVFGSYTGITNGGFDVAIDGTNHPITALNFSSAGSMAAIATIIQTALNAALAGTTCTWTGTYFLITSPTTGTSSSVGFAVAPTGGGAPTDASTILGLTAAAGALTVAGIAIETMTASLVASKLFNPSFYGVHLVDNSTQDVKDAAAWGQSNQTIIAYTTNDPNAKLSSATSDLFYFFKNLGYDYAFGQYSNTPYAAMSALARLFVVDFDQPNSTITLKFKQEPGIATEALTDTDVAALKAKNANYYVDRGGFAMLEEGVMANGRFADEVQGLDWLQANLQTAYFTALATTPTKVPLTDAGMGALVQAATGTFEKARANGLIAPGIWNGDDLGEKKSGDYLATGYYIYAALVATLSQSDRNVRKSPPVSAICIGAGAIHSSAITVTFQR